MSLEKTFPIYKKTHKSGNVGFRVDMGKIGKKRIFKSFPSEASAQTFQRKCLAAEAKKKPVELRDLEDLMRHEVLAALAKLREYNAGITEAVDFFIRHARTSKANATIGEVMTEFKAAKLKGGRTSKYLDTAWNSFFVPFRDHFKNCEIADVTSQECEKYVFKSKVWNATTRRSHIRHLSVLFNFAKDKKYTGINPFDDVEMPKKPASTSKKRVVTVDNVIKFLRYAYDNGYRQECAAMVLILFCGVRVDEVARLTWEDVHLDADRPEVVLGEDQTKTGSGRINRIPANALEWLKSLRGKGLITPPNYENRMRYLRQKTKAGFKQNSARVSFASYHLARYEDAPKTAFLLGHDNPTLLYKNYKAVVTKEEAIRFWKITPDYNGEDIVHRVTEEDIQRARAAGIAKGMARPR